ncbi:MAG: UDP-N-acetylmuramoylalanine--D-glutamate ligase [Candidatus Anoxychlamydiales bacterium]|nr:UDP-N-acetylmuramoylalanine--D-glutamate ligase [Candidatus Anoxychlamydiales bacterium]
MQKKQLILGLGLSGRAAAFFLLSQNKKVIAIDNNLKEDDEIKKLKKNKNIEIFKKNLVDFSKIEKVIVSPGIDPKHEILKKAQKNNIEIISEVELGALFLKNRCIGITGTNGKTTLTKLIVHILNENNIQAKALGNIKTPITSYINQADIDDILIIELSSFQLEKMYTKFLDAAIITNITPDHLDRYLSFEDYVEAKLNILRCLKNENFLYATQKVLKTFIVKNSNINIKEVKEDVVDIAIDVCMDLSIEKENILKAIKTFKKVEHRLEFVREIKNISFYNDSKATNVHSVIYAVMKIQTPIILIAGGVDKGSSYNEWKKVFENRVEYILLIGESSKKIEKELKGFKVQICSSLKIALEKAFSLAKKNYSILFSPGCSSFDMFKNFEHRGEEFKKIVNRL